MALSELGVGTAITYALYKPIAEGDIEKQKSLMLLYRKFYRLVACVVLVGGLMVIPFMDVLIKNQPKVDHLILIYLLYLANSVISYLLIYKKTLIDAHQLSYIGEVYQMICIVIQDVLQIVVLLTTHNFMLFLIIYIVCTLANNISVSVKANRLYPYLRDKNIQPLEKTEQKSIFKNIRAMLMHKIGDVVINNTDNLMLSAMVGILSVGCYYNYYLVIGSIHQLLNQVFRGITASVGNLGVTEDRFRVRRIFESSFFVGQWIYGFASICLFELLNPFVEISFGKNYLFPISVVFVLCLNFFMTGMRQATLVFRDSLGLFWFDRYKSLIGAILNLILSILLAYRYGTIGVFLGTLISALLTSFWVEPWILYRHSLKVSVKSYFGRYLVYTCITATAGYLTDFLCRQVTGNVWSVLGIRLLICMVVPNIIFLLCYRKTKEFIFLFEKLRGVWAKYRNQEKKAGFQPEEIWLLDTLASLIGKREKEEKIQELDWEKICRLAGNHAVLPFLYPLTETKEISSELKEQIQRVSLVTVQQSYRLLFLSHYIVEKLTEKQVPVVLLKGVATAQLYPVPELRKSGDIDLLLTDLEKFDIASTVLDGIAVRDDSGHSVNHHCVWRTAEGIEIELHVMLAEPFDSDETNEYLEKLVKNISQKIECKTIMGLDFPVLPESYHAYYLLLHMLQHFLRSGFGLKLLCDWVVFWNRELEEKDVEQYCQQIAASGLSGFSDMVTAVCQKGLGLEKDKAERIMVHIPKESVRHAFLRDVLEAEEFGNAKERMVIMRGTGIWDYFREFHHQMKLNFPKKSRYYICWPVLWGITFVRFSQNNRKIRGVSSVHILRKAKERSRYARELHLFQKKEIKKYKKNM